MDGLTRKKYKLKQRSADKTTTTLSLMQTIGLADTCCVSGYTQLDKIPAIVSACRTIASAIGIMTIHLMENTPDGDKRIQNELSKKIDINPCKYMTRSQFIEYIVMNMLLYGKGNAVVKVKTRNGLLMNLQPVPADRFTLESDVTGYDYKINIDGVRHNPDDVLHFVYNPDRDYPWKGMGVTASAKDIADCLNQAQATEKGFMKSEWKPSLIVKVDGLTEEFADKDGRQKLMDNYIQTSNAGDPWIIPADLLEIQEVRPLSLNDIALKDGVELDTKKIAALFGVPSFVLGVGEYSEKEWNNFIVNRVTPIAISMQQELTRKLIINPKWYLKFNYLSRLSYDISTVADVYTKLQDRGDVSGNEVRDKLGLSPVKGLDEYKILENYIPVSESGNQKKLKGEEK